MTSDAKIGLLLGLIFIFVIAFVINGLPNLRPQTTKAEMTTNMVSLRDENLGLVDKEQKAQETLNWAELLDRQTGDLDVSEPTVTNSEPPAEAPESSATADGSSDNVRSILPLPTGDAVEKLTQGLESIVKSLAEASKPATVQETTTGPAPVVEAPKPERAETPQVTVTVTPENATAPAPPKTYVVADGDSLASVAKKVYGLEQGNRMVNVQRIYEANRSVLSSPDEIHIGQKLIIPTPARPAAAKKDAANVLPKTLFDKVQSIGKKHLDSMDRRETPGRHYVVQDGDNLWKIAVAQLGSGARYEEIAKLNADLLKDKDMLAIGTRLRLPSN